MRADRAVPTRARALRAAPRPPGHGGRGTPGHERLTARARPIARRTVIGEEAAPEAPLGGMEDVVDAPPPAVMEEPAPEPVAEPEVDKLKEFEDQKRGELAKKAEEETAKIAELRETAKAWLAEQAAQREKTLGERKCVGAPFGRRAPPRSRAPVRGPTDDGDDANARNRRNQNRQNEELEAHVPSSNAWEEVSTLVDLSVGAGEAEDNNRMRETILKMKHKSAGIAA